MFFDDQKSLEQRSSVYRYIYFLITSCSMKSFFAWKRNGEPNPFVPVKARARQTHQQEIIDIFEDSLGRR